MAPARRKVGLGKGRRAPPGPHRFRVSRPDSSSPTPSLLGSGCVGHVCWISSRLRVSCLVVKILLDFFVMFFSYLVSSLSILCCFFVPGRMRGL